MSTPKVDPVVLSMIKKVMPSLVAQDILSVQPMSSPFSKEEWPYQIDVLSLVRFTDILKLKRWCEDSLEQDEWTHKVQFYAFKTEKAYITFKLAWE